MAGASPLLRPPYDPSIKMGLRDKVGQDKVGQENAGRRFAFRRVGLGAGIAAMAAAGVAAIAEPATAATLTDPEILNFALNLEYLEAEFYLRAFLGTGLQSSDVTGVGTQGSVTGGSAVPFQSEAIAQYAQTLAVDELTHVRFLRTSLGAAAVAEPSIDLGKSFTTLAVAAGLIQSGQTFNPFADEISFLIGAYIFEDVGVTAYAGAARYITDPNYLEAAGAILAVEAYHGGAIRTLLANTGGGQVANAISALRAQLSGAQDDMGIIIPGDNYNFASADINALAFRRTPAQVLNIVYGGGPAGTGGLFFPAGMNGTLR